METQNALVIFQGTKIRRTWYANAWWFVLEDIVKALTDSADPKQYIQKMKQRDEPLSEGWVQLVHTLPVKTSGGEQQMNCVNTAGGFRIIQSIPSPKAEPFKRWLAQVGYERVQDNLAKVREFKRQAYKEFLREAKTNLSGPERCAVFCVGS